MLSMPAISGCGGNENAVKSRSGHASAAGFTLLEMVTVMAIIAIATAVAMPAIGSLTKSSSRRAALSLTIGGLDQVRALALSKSSNYYLVFADNSPDWPEDYRCRSFAIFEEVFFPNAAAGSQYRCLPVTTWTRLPVGVAFNPSATTIFGATTRKMVYFAPLGKEINAAYLKFNGIGAVEEPSDSALAYVRIFEGYVDANGSLTFTNKAAAAEEVIKISLITGRAKREEP
jgi:prepilin-type N-terminal cleavage/methylation domain-containing protein